MRMRSTIKAALVAGLLVSGAALAADEMKMGEMMRSMDTNGDGMVSKAEFTKHHEAMWKKMKKGANGMVDLKNSENDHMGPGGMAKDHPMPEKKGY
jgi:hypothetical protein